MMPFYYGSRARSVPEYLRLRFDEKTRGLNAISFAIMTIFSSGISMYAMAKLIQVLHVFDGAFHKLGLSQSGIFDFSIIVSAVVVLVYTFLGGLSSAIYNEVLQFFLIVAGFLPLELAGTQERRRMVGVEGQTRSQFRALVGRNGSREYQPVGSGMVRPGDGIGLRAVVRLLVHGFSRGAARDGGEFDERGAAHAADRRAAENVVSVSGDPAGIDRDLAAEPHAAGAGECPCAIAVRPQRTCRPRRARD